MYRSYVAIFILESGPLAVKQGTSLDIPVIREPEMDIYLKSYLSSQVN